MCRLDWGLGPGRARSLGCDAGTPRGGGHFRGGVPGGARLPGPSASAPLPRPPSASAWPCRPPSFPWQARGGSWGPLSACVCVAPGAWKFAVGLEVTPQGARRGPWRRREGGARVLRAWGGAARGTKEWQERRRRRRRGAARRGCKGRERRLEGRRGGEAPHWRRRSTTASWTARRTRVRRKGARSGRG